jgi:N-succinyldiaminopimelate aminotransferase
MVQRASAAAWSDEAHVVANREQYRAKFAQVMPLLSPVLEVALPDAAFYLWASVPGGDDIAFAQGLLAQYNVQVLPGSLLARTALPDGRAVKGSVLEPGAHNPGQGRIRMALVAPVAECVEAAQRIVSYIKGL